MPGERETIPSVEIFTNLPVIIVVGMAGAGKGVVCEIIQKHFGMPSTSISSVINELLKSDGQQEPYTRRQRKEKFTEVSTIHGMDAFARLIIQRGIDTHTQSPIQGIVIDGPRHPEEVELVKRLPNGIAIGIHATELTRYERVRHRRRAGDIEYLDQFRALDREEGPEITAALAHVDKIFFNDESTTIAYQKLESDIISWLEPRIGLTV